MHMCTYMCVYVCTRVCMHLSICAVLHMCRWTCLPTRAHIDGPVHMHTSYVQKCTYKNTLACLLPRSVWAMGPEHLGCGGAVFPTRLGVRPGVGNTWEVVPCPGAGERGLELGWIVYPCPHPRTKPCLVLGRVGLPGRPACLLRPAVRAAAKVTTVVSFLLGSAHPVAGSLQDRELRGVCSEM